MVSVKHQVIQAVEQMDDDVLFSLWDMICRHFDTPLKKILWDDIEEVEPDEIDLQMIKEMKDDPDSNIYVSLNDVISRRLLK